MPPNCSLNDHRRSTQSVGILNDLIRPLLTYVCLYSPADWAHFTLFHTNIKGDMFLIEGKSFPSVKTQKCIFFCYTPLHHLTVWQLLLPCGKGRHSQMWFHVILSRKMSTRLHSVVVSPCFDCSSLPLYFITHNYTSTFRLWSCKHRQPSLPIFPNWNLLHSRFSTIRQRESQSLILSKSGGVRFFFSWYLSVCTVFPAYFSLFCFVACPHLHVSVNYQREEAAQFWVDSQLTGRKEPHLFAQFYKKMLSFFCRCTLNNVLYF